MWRVIRLGLQAIGKGGGAGPVLGVGGFQVLRRQLRDLPRGGQAALGGEGVVVGLGGEGEGVLQGRVLAGVGQQSHFLETVRGIRPLKLFQRQDERRSVWLGLLVEQINAGLRTQKLQLFYQQLNGLLFGVENLLVERAAPARRRDRQQRRQPARPWPQRQHAAGRWRPEQRLRRAGKRQPGPRPATGQPGQRRRAHPPH